LIGVNILFTPPHIAMSQSPVYIEKVENINMVSSHPSLLLR
jgi:hypothetical protein